MGLREALTCPTPTSCWAINETSSNTLLHWNGHTWSQTTVPLPHGPAGSKVGDGLHDLACVSNSDCWAVGAYSIENGSSITGGWVTEHWNGKAWHFVQAPLPASAVGATGQAYFDGITCISAGNCWAVGGDGVAASASHWDGHRWLPRTVAPLTGPDTGAGLVDVACAGFDCWAVGASHGNVFTPAVDTSTSYIVLHLVKGTWVKVPSPVQPVSAMEDTVHIACPASNSCWIAGSRYDARTYDVRKGLAVQLNDMLHWDGKRWTSVPVPSPGGDKVKTVSGFTAFPASGLLDLTCVSVDDCWAVGADAKPANPPLVRAQVLHWDGHHWTVLAAPRPAGVVDAGLVGVACPKGHGCEVLGHGVTNEVVVVLLARRTVGHWAY